MDFNKAVSIYDTIRRARSDRTLVSLPEVLELDQACKEESFIQSVAYVAKVSVTDILKDIDGIVSP